MRNDIRNAEVQLNRYLAFLPSARALCGPLGDFRGRVDISEEAAVERAVLHRPDLMVARKSVEVATRICMPPWAAFCPGWTHL